MKILVQYLHMMCVHSTKLFFTSAKTLKKNLLMLIQRANLVILHIYFPPCAMKIEAAKIKEHTWIDALSYSCSKTGIAYARVTLAIFLHYCPYNIKTSKYSPATKEHS